MISKPVFRKINTGSVTQTPMTVTINEKKTQTIIDWANIKEAFLLSPFPSALAIKAVTPMDNPVVAPIIIK